MPKKFSRRKSRARVHPAQLLEDHEVHAERVLHSEDHTGTEPHHLHPPLHRISAPPIANYGHPPHKRTLALNKPKVALTTVPIHIGEVERHLAPREPEPVTTKEGEKVPEKETRSQSQRDNEIYEKLQSEDDGEGEEEADDKTEDLVLGEGQVYDDPDRPLWSSEIDFLLSIIGFAVDVTSIWNFPFLCVKYGGGLFLVPYLIILITCGIPIFYMELLVGQYVRQGCISVWKLCPLFKGVGVCMVIVSYVTSLSYNVVLGWALIYIYESTQSPLLWTRCGDAHDHKDVYWTDANCTSTTDSENHETDVVIPNAAEQFFKRKILEMYEVVNRTVTKQYSIEDLGHPDDSLAVILLFVYVILLLVLLFGIKVTGKVVWITATLPYLILGVLLFRGLTLPGAKDGLLFFMRANPQMLADIDTWRAAGVQVFYSLGVGFGVHLTLSSFNKFHHNLLFDCIITAGINTMTSVLAGLVIFSFLGNMSYSIRAQVQQLSEYAQGPQLVFDLFPQAMGRLPGSNFFAFIFFLLVFVIGMDTSMCAMQSIQVACIDNFKAQFNRHAHSKEVFMFVILIFSFFFALACVTHGGIYIFQVLDKNSATVSLIAATLLQCIGLAWIYGTQNLCEIAESMTGQYPSIYFIICWKYVAPSFLLTILYSTIKDVFDTSPEFDGVAVSTPYWILGICLALAPMLSIPIAAIYVIRKMKTSDACKSRFLLAISPEHEHEEIRRTGIASRSNASHYLWMRCGRKKPSGTQEGQGPRYSLFERKKRRSGSAKEVSFSAEETKAE